MRAFLPLLVLLAQTPEPDLEQDYLATFSGTPQAMVAIVATYANGAPVRGTIQCAGYWVKYADETVLRGGWAYPFETDSRGGIVMNPRKDDEWLVCWSESRGLRGEVRVDLTAEPRVHHIVVEDAP